MSFLNLTDVKVDDSFDVLPEGTYNIVCHDAEVRDTKDGTGQYINCEMKVLGPKRKDSRIFQMYNIKNKNPKAVEIGLSQLKTFMINAGCENLSLESVTDLIGLKVTVKTKIQKSEGYDDKAAIKSYKPFDASLGDSTAVISPSLDEIPF